MHLLVGVCRAGVINLEKKAARLIIIASRVRPPAATFEKSSTKFLTI